METKVVLEYRRKKPVWVCMNCDTENDYESGICLFCGSGRTGNEWVIDAWSPPRTQPVPPFPNPGPTPTPMPMPTPTPMPPASNSSSLVWLIVGAVILFLTLLIAIIVNA